MNLNREHLLLSEDFSKIIREERSVLYKFYKQGREEGKNIKMGYNYIVLNGKRLYYDDILSSNRTPTSSKKKQTPRRRKMVRKRSSDKEAGETSQTDDSNRPSTPILSQLDQWLGTVKTQKKQKTSNRPAVSE